MSSLQNQLLKTGLTTKQKARQAKSNKRKKNKQKRSGRKVEESLQEQMQQNYVQAIIQEKVNPAGAPYFEPKNLKRGEDLEFIATFEVFPEVEVKDVEAIEIEQGRSAHTRTWEIEGPCSQGQECGKRRSMQDSHHVRQPITSRNNNYLPRWS